MTNNKGQAGKLMKNLSMVIMAVLGIVSLGILVGCADALISPLQEGDEGTGRALVRIGTQANGARTLMPSNTEDYDTLSYTLTFTPISGGGVEKSLDIEGGGEAAVALEAGLWDLSVTGYKNETALLEGSASGIEIRSGENTDVPVAMKVKTEGGSGILRYSVTFPDTVNKGWLRVYGWDDGSLKQTVDLLENSPSSGGTKTRSGDLTLPGGYYRLGIDLYTTNGTLNRNDIAHIYPGQTTAMETGYAVFGLGDFVTETSLTGVLNSIGGLLDGADMDYTLEAGDETMSPVSVSHTGPGSVTVTIDGGGRTVTLNGNGSLIAIGSGVTLKLNNITLQGQGIGVNNTATLIQVNTGGTLELNDGVVITGNNNNTAASSSYGGGVYVGGGTFIMDGGEISGNTASFPRPSGFFSLGGGGVYIGYQGTFTMNDGEISGNTVDPSSYGSAGSTGGGVFIAGDGTFTMNGGKISGNTALPFHGSNGIYSSAGGGVYMYIEGGGTFTMSGGEISGNTATSGGGVCVGSGTFTMSGGEISDNTADTFGGGGVRIKANGTFIMSGGKISGNTVESSSSFPEAYGGGVNIENGTFTMSGGEISGNTADSADSASYGGGGGVYIWGGTFTKKGGTIYGDTDAIAGNGNATDNTATSGGGHAVYLAEPTFSSSGATLRNSTADPAVKLYARYDYDYSGGPYCTLILNDTSTGGVGDTTANWEE